MNRKTHSRKPFWQTELFVLLALIFFWPLGIFLMWKYSTTNTLIKIVLTIITFFVLMPNFLLFLLNTHSFFYRMIYPIKINTSQIYRCEPINNQWGKCASKKYKFSFEYPVKWNYVDLRPQGIGFSPLKKDIGDDFIISVSVSESKTSEEARQFARGFFNASRREEITVNGLYATRDYKIYPDGTPNLFAVIVEDRTIYIFHGPIDKKRMINAALSYEELKIIFDYMLNSFVREK